MHVFASCSRDELGEDAALRQAAFPTVGAPGLIGGRACLWPVLLRQLAAFAPAFRSLSSMLWRMA